jgi:hypothetical protein
MFGSKIDLWLKLTGCPKEPQPSREYANLASLAPIKPPLATVILIVFRGELVKYAFLLNEPNA